MRFSVIIPTLNEAPTIGQQINYIKSLDQNVEIIISDGGSSDNTVEIVKKQGAKMIKSKPGRGTQQRAGAKKAKGDILLFLHADTILPRNAFSILNRYFDDPSNLVATFKIHFHPPFLILRLISVFTRFDTVITKFGDQCIVIRRSFYNQLGGFSDIPLFEDVYLLDRARKCTRVGSIPGIVVSSTRRFKRNGVLRQLIWNAWLVLLYYLGRAPDKLAEMYRISL